MILIIIRDSFFKFIQLTLVKLNVINDLTLLPYSQINYVIINLPGNETLRLKEESDGTSTNIQPQQKNLCRLQA